MICWRASELLCFNYSSEEEKLVFAARIPCLDREITMFAHLSADYYLLVALSDQSTHADNQFIVKKWTENNVTNRNNLIISKFIFQVLF